MNHQLTLVAQGQSLHLQADKAQRSRRSRALSKASRMALPGSRRRSSAVSRSSRERGPRAARGWDGAIAATAGCVLCGCVIALLLFGVFRRYGQSPGMVQALGGLRAASAGLIASAVASIVMLSIWLPTGGIEWRGLCLLTLMLTWLRLGKPHPMLVMLFSGGAGVLLYGI